MSSAVLLGSLAGCTTGSTSSSPAGAGPGSAASAPAVQLTAPADFRASLAQSRKTRPDGLIEWRTNWVLRWDAVPGVERYRVDFATSEGRGGRSRTVDAPEVRIEAAAGTSPANRVASDEKAQLAFTGSQLLVSVRAVAGKATGPASAWYRVGDAPPDGKPVPNSAPEGHEGH